MFWILTWIRFQSHSPQWKKLPVLAGSDLDRFIKDSTIAVVLFPDVKGESFSFVDFAISKYPSINFTFATHEDGKKFNIQFYPNALGFIRGKPVPGRSVQRPLQFASFCDSMIKSTLSTIPLVSMEQLRSVLDSDRSVLLDVDECKPLKGDSVFCTTSQNMKLFGINATRGYYVYRGQDRQLIPVTRSNYQQHMMTYVQNARSAMLASRPYFAGYFMNEQDPSENEKELAILAKLSQIEDLRENFNIGPIVGTMSVIFAQAAHVEYLRWPLFLVIRSESEGRWVVIDEKKVHNVDYLAGLLERIARGDEPMVPVSEKIPKHEKMWINNKRFWKSVEGDGVPSAVAIVDRLNPASEIVADMFRRAATLIGNEASFYIFDAAKNDIPAGVTVTDIPVIKLYPSGKGVGAETYSGALELQDFVTWVRENRSSNDITTEL